MTCTLLTGSSPVLMYGDRGAITSCAADSATGSGKGGGGGTDERLPCDSEVEPALPS